MHLVSNSVTTTVPVNLGEMTHSSPVVYSPGPSHTQRPSLDGWMRQYWLPDVMSQ